MKIPGFFDKLAEFKMAQPVGWEYRYAHLTLLGVAPAPTVSGGFVIPFPGTATTGFKFSSASIIVRVDLTFAVYDGTTNQLFGAGVFKNPGAEVNVLGAESALLVSYVRNNLAVLPSVVTITKTINLSPWTGIKIMPNEYLALGWVGDGVSFVNVGSDIMYISSPGNTVLNE